jgi:hypothetical protein
MAGRCADDSKGISCRSWVKGYLPDYAGAMTGVPQTAGEFPQCPRSAATGQRSDLVPANAVLADDGAAAHRGPAACNLLAENMVILRPR